MRDKKERYENDSVVSLLRACISIERVEGEAVNIAGMCGNDVASEHFRNNLQQIHSARNLVVVKFKAEVATPDCATAN